MPSWPNYARNQGKEKLKMEGFEDKQNRGLIIFDFDGTLGDTRRNIVTTMQMTIKEMQLPERSEAECASTIGLPLAGCFRTLFPDIQEELIPQCAETYRRIFNENLQKITPEAFPGVVKTLKTLKEHGFAFTIASSRSRNSLMEPTISLTEWKN